MNDILSILTSVGAIVPNGHFVGTSGRHFDTYINKDNLSLHTQKISEVGKIFAEKYKDRDIDVVVAPAVGGIAFSQWVAHHLSELKGSEVLAIFTEKTADNGQVLKRGYDKIVEGKNCLVIEDLTTTGGSVKKVVETVQQAGGKVVEVCVMVNREPSHVTSETIGVPFSQLAVLEIPSYDANECPLCRSGVPVNTELGHGKKFLAEKENI